MFVLILNNLLVGSNFENTSKDAEYTAFILSYTSLLNHLCKDEQGYYRLQIGRFE